MNQKQRRRRNRHANAIEQLEVRILPATLGATNTAVLDFDGETFNHEELTEAWSWDLDDFKNVQNGEVSFPPFHSIFTPDRTQLDVDGNGITDSRDADRIIEMVVAKVRQDYAPYDLNIVVDDQDDVRGMFHDQIHGDSLVIISGGIDNTNFRATPAGGWAGYDEGNARDGLALAFTGTRGEMTVSRLVNSVAQTISHELGHTFGLRHHSTDPTGDTEAITHNIMATTNTDTTRDFSLHDRPYNTVRGTEVRPPQNAHAILSQPDVLGPSHDPWIAVLQPGILTVSGSAGDDTIRVTSGSPGLWNVQFAGRAALVSIDSLDRDSLNAFDSPLTMISIDGGGGNDTITVASDVDATVTIDDGIGADNLADRLDVDANGTTGPLTDGLLILRFLAGFADHALVNGVVDSQDGQRTTASEVREYLTAMRDSLDVDGNQAIEPLSDGILIVRFLAGFRGDALTEDAIDVANAERLTPAEIEAYFDQYFVHAESAGRSTRAKTESTGVVELSTVAQSLVARNSTSRSRLNTDRVEGSHELRRGPVDTTDRLDVLDEYFTRYVPNRASEVSWSGSVAGCDPGVPDAASTAATLDMVNFFRNMVGVNDVSFDSSLSRKAQEAALMMQAENRLSHQPTSDWACYSADGAEAAGRSNLYLGRTGPASIAGYIEDPGQNNTAVGHRRWILYPDTETMGVGSTSRANALWVISPSIDQPSPDWIPWPPAGHVTKDLVFPRWSLSHDDADFSQASVSMTLDGAVVSLQQHTIRNGFGWNTIVWEPLNFRVPDVGKDARISVTVQNVIVGGSPQTYDYEVIAIDPRRPTVAIQLVQQSVSENAGILPDFLTLTRDELDREAAWPITLTSSDTSEVSVPSTITIPSGATSINVPLTVVNDSEFDGTQEIIITARIGTLSTATASISVDDNDARVPFSLDIDANGTATPLSDGILILRYLAGFDGGVLTANTVGPDSVRSLPADVEAFFVNSQTELDVDGNKILEPLADGILFMRFLAGFRGAGLTANAIGNGALRTDPADIADYLNAFVPGNATLTRNAPSDPVPGSESMARSTKGCLLSIRFDGLDAGHELRGNGSIL